MQNNGLGTLVGLILIVVVAVGFIVASRAVIASFSPVAVSPALPTALPTLVVPPAAATAISIHAVKPTPTSLAHQVATPVPTVAPTSVTSVRVTPALSTNVDQSPNQPTTTFATSAQYIWCSFFFPRLPVGASWRIHWVSNPSGTVIFEYPTDGPRVQDTTQVNVYKGFYLDGPMQPGQYACQAWVNGAMAGSATFSVHP